MTKEQATRRAKNCLRRMKTKGWTIRVYENIGWHWNLQCKDGHLTLYGSLNSRGRIRYSCLASMSTPGAGDYNWYDTSSHTNPNDAVSVQVELIKKHSVQIIKFYASLMKALYPEKYK